MKISVIFSFRTELCFTVWFPKASTAMMGFGAISHTLIIGRYLCCPVIATSRIDKYDGESVTFHYNRHEGEKYVEETLPAIDFIKRLIKHIPDANVNIKL